MSTYERRELTRVLAHGPADGETFYRVKVTGAVESRWLNLTAAQVAALVEVMERDQ